jgi:polysaccharide pyruvyl transferase WcaK-like protein
MSIVDRFGFGGRDGKNLNLIGCLDTSIGSLNVGDNVICESCYSIIDGLFPSCQTVQLGTHDGISSIGISRINKAKFRFVFGTNLLSGRKFSSAQWNYSLYDAVRLKDLILLGVGWSEYSKNVSFYSKIFYKSILSDSYTHSVRDEYSRTKFVDATNLKVLNTGCPTTWALTPEHIKGIPKFKADNVVTTFTDYRPNIERDKKLVNLLLDSYNCVYIWPQSVADLTYFKKLCLYSDKIKILSPKLSSFDEILSYSNIDYVGTRLHGGIRALQNKKRTIIIGLDNRAIEMKQDIGLPVVSENDFLVSDFSRILTEDFECDINIRSSEIDEWKSQFDH